MGGEIVDIDIGGVECRWWQTKKEVGEDRSTPALHATQHTANGMSAETYHDQVSS